MNKIKWLFAMMCVVAMFAMTGCEVADGSGNEEPILTDENSFTVTFDTNGGSTMEPIRVAKGTAMSEPDDTATIRDHYKVAGWYFGKGKWDFNTPIPANITLKALWERVKHRVTYYRDNKNGTLPQAKMIEYGEPILRLSNWGVSEGKYFDCWCSDKALTKVCDITTHIVTGNITLWGRWGNIYDEEFNKDSETTATVTTDKGNKMKITTVPTTFSNGKFYVELKVSILNGSGNVIDGREDIVYHHDTTRKTDEGFDLSYYIQVNDTGHDTFGQERIYAKLLEDSTKFEVSIKKTDNSIYDTATFDWPLGGSN